MLLKGLISLIFGQKNGNFKQILVSNWVSVHLMEVSVSVSVSKFYSWKVSVSISVSKFYNWKVSVSYRYPIFIPAWYKHCIGIGKSGIEDLWNETMAMRTKLRETTVRWFAHVSAQETRKDFTKEMLLKQYKRMACNFLAIQKNNSSLYENPKHNAKNLEQYSADVLQWWSEIMTLPLVIFGRGSRNSVIAFW